MSILPMFHSEILPHKISTRIKSGPLDWRRTIYWNVVLIIFQHKHWCQDSWKNARSTFKCIIILQSRGQDPKKSDNYGTNLCPTINKNQDLVPWIGEEQCIELLSLHFSNIPYITVYVGKLLSQHFNVRMFFNPGDKIFLVKI